MSLKANAGLLKSSSFRHTLLTAFAIWLSTSVVLILVYFNLETAIWNSINHRLDEQSESILQQASEQAEYDAQALIAEMHGSGAISLQVTPPMSPEMMSMHNSPAMQEMHRAMGLASPSRQLLGENQSLASDRGQLVLLRNIELPGGETLTLSHNVDYLADIQNSLWHSLVFGLVITLLIAAFSAALLTQRSLRRMHQINTGCHAIMAGNLDYRIPYKHRASKFDDYDRMAQTINQMLDEINELVTKVRQVSDNIAHDLKSPLARLRTRLESLNGELATAEVADGIHELDRLLAMINSLLGISRLESANRKSFGPVELQPLLTDVAEMYQPLFEEKGIEFQATVCKAALTADKNLLFQALVNVLDNALKFTPEAGRVSLIAEQLSEGSVSIEIRDSGPGVQNTAKILERFYREDAARDASGFGLGLSLVQAIVKLHEGRIELQNDSGLVVRLTLPVAGGRALRLG
ncbi:sensor histidine kinase [Reinekea marinisedimentorum]|uniref:histidine kinase n=1 Tax=Reinekea marinisedimentorum TaxID=230495 RepID=A0A4R3HVH2_9GAMM|nr:HAMP domain-containing sensor histidine kinase [Reinekea marinisedimentorum]TCS36764.1 signal transduction histidine kinase [Reinekea marinisedimentorum]